MATVLLLSSGAIAQEPMHHDSSTQLVPRDTALAGDSLPEDALPRERLFADSSVQEVNTIGALSHTSDTVIADSILADSVAAHAETDTTELDSAELAALTDSILSAQRETAISIQSYPESADSLFDPFNLYLFHIYNADAAGISEILRFHPLVFPVPLTLSSSKNRFQYMGLPARLTQASENGAIFGITPRSHLGSDLLCAGEIHSVHMPDPTKLWYEAFPTHLAAPQTLMLWETGVFDENSLNVRFARPLGEMIDIGIFSTYRSFARQEYSHTTGDMHNFFKGIYTSLGVDTSRVANRGINPLTFEQATKIVLRLYGKNGVTIKSSYQYEDIHNDLSFEYSDTANTQLAWDENLRFRHLATMRFDNIALGPFIGRGETYVTKEVDRLTPLIQYNSGRTKQRGEMLSGGGAATVGLHLVKDTVQLVSNATWTRNTPYDGSGRVIHDIRTGVRYSRDVSLGPIVANANGDLGHVAFNYNDSIEHGFRWQANVSVQWARQKATLFAKNDFLRTDIPYDSSVSIDRGTLARINHHRLWGLTSRFGTKKLGIIAGYTAVNQLNKTAIAASWPDARLPYETPRWVVSVAPTLGRWHGLGFTSAWVFSDAKPTIRNHTSLSFHPPKQGSRPQLFMDLVLDHWSDRDAVSFGGVTDWNRAIYDVYFKTAVQIRTFRLYYKIDNLFNQRVAYVPGYMMPGLTFRWGFNWLLPG